MIAETARARITVRLAMLVVACAIGCGPAKEAEAPALSPTATADAGADSATTVLPSPVRPEKRYVLNRKVYRVTLNRVPLVRTRCWVSEKVTSNLEAAKRAERTALDAARASMTKLHETFSAELRKKLPGMDAAKRAELEGKYKAAVDANTQAVKCDPPATCADRTAEKTEREKALEYVTALEQAGASKGLAAAAATLFEAAEKDREEKRKKLTAITDKKKDAALFLAVEAEFLEAEKKVDNTRELVATAGRAVADVTSAARRSWERAAEAAKLAAAEESAAGGNPAAESAAARLRSVRPVSDVRMIEWDPSSPGPLERRVALRGEDASLRCSAEPSALGNDKALRTFTYLFDFVDVTPAKGGVPAKKEIIEPVNKGCIEAAADKTPYRLEGRWAEVGGAAGVADAGAQSRSAVVGEGFNLDVTMNVERGADPELGGIDAQFSKNRSLDPLTPVLTELATVVAEVALERAKGHAAERMKESLYSTVCRLNYRDDYGPELDINKNGDTTSGAPLTEKRVLDRVCKALDAVRIEEIAASAPVLGRALAGDLTHYAFRLLRRRLPKVPELDEIIRALESLAQGLISGDAPGTERDVQMMLLKLGRVPVASNDALPVDDVVPPPRADQRRPTTMLAVGIPGDLANASTQASDKLLEGEWRCAIGIGFAVVRDCLRQDSCSVESLQASLEREFSEPTAGSCSAEIAAIKRGWPELGSVLAKSIDVLRPPPGTTPNTTAKLASNVFFEVAKKRLDPDERRVIDDGQAIVNAIFDKDYLSASIAAASLLVGEIDRECKADKAKCNALDVTSSQMKKGVAVLNGFISYASTYREGTREGEQGKTDTERDTLRHDERKKAMEALIDSATDRTNRRYQGIFSLGVGVGFSPNMRYARGGGTGQDVGAFVFMPQLALPTGLGFDYFGTHAGLHVQANVFDLGQYAAVDSETGGLAKPTPATAVSPSLQVALALGSPRVPVLLGLNGGYSPGFKPDDFAPACPPGAPCPAAIGRRPGGAFLGAFLGTYVPFFDFN